MQNSSVSSSNIAWVDWIRVIACFLVVLAHCCDPFVANFDNNYSEFFSGALIGSLVRPCVPLFVMISGVLLLPVNQDMGTFYRRRLSRVVVPLVIWSLLLPVLYYLYFTIGGVESANPNIDLAEHTLEGTLPKLWTWVINFNYTTVPLWYLYMLVGLYLFMPIISGWLKTAARKDIKIFLWIWVVSMFMPYVVMGAPAVGYGGNYGSMDILGGCLWNPYGTFYYFSGFLGYLVLAYYLKTYPLEWSRAKILAVAVPMFLVGYAITFGGFVLTQEYYPGSYDALEIIWYFSGINVFLMTFAAYIVMQSIATKSSKIIAKIAPLTFGIYLCHWILVQIGYDVLYPILPLPALLQIPLIAIVVFLVSLLVTWLLSKLPFRKYIIG